MKHITTPLVALVATLPCANSLLADDHGSAPVAYGQAYLLNVSDPGAVVAAMTQFRNSAAGKQSPANVSVNQTVAGGQSGASHTITVVYGPAANMDKNYALTSQSKAFAEMGVSLMAFTAVRAQTRCGATTEMTDCTPPRGLRAGHVRMSCI